MSLLASINSSLSGLGVTQRSIEVLSSNVSNASNPDYVRENAVVTSRLGGGAEIASIERFVDRFLAAKLGDARSDLAAASSEADTRQRLEDIVAGGDEAARLDTLLSGLRSDVARAAASPSDPVLRRAITVSADRLARRLNEMSGLLSELRGALDARYAELATDLSTRLGELETANRTIVTTAYDTGALRTLEDRRDAIISQVSQLVPVNRFDRQSRDVALYAGQGRPLFDLAAARIEVRHGPDGASILLDGEPIDRELAGGELGALRKLRDDAIPGILSSLDEIAAELASATNAAHASAVSSARRSSWTAAYASDSFQQVDLSSTRILLRDDAGRVVAQLGFQAGSLASDGTSLRAALEGKLDPDGVPYLRVASGAGRISIAINEAGRARGLSIEFATTGPGPGLKQALHLDDVFVGAAAAASLAFETRSAADVGTPPVATLRVTGDPRRLQALVGREIAFAGARDGQLAFRRIVSWDPATETATLDRAWGGAEPQAGTPFRTFLPSAATISLRADLLADPSRLATGTVDSAGDLVGMLVGGTGDGRGLEAMATALEEARAVVADPEGRRASLASMVRDRLAEVAGANADAQARHKERTAIQDALAQQSASLSGVDVDEEMAQLILLQNAYAASARVLSTIGDLFQRLLQI